MDDLGDDLLSEIFKGLPLCDRCGATCLWDGTVHLCRTVASAYQQCQCVPPHVCKLALQSAAGLCAPPLACHGNRLPCSGGLAETLRQERATWSQLHLRQPDALVSSTRLPHSGPAAFRHRPRPHQMARCALICCAYEHALFSMSTHDSFAGTFAMLLSE